MADGFTDKNFLHTKALGEEKVGRLIFRYSIPSMLSTIIDAAYSAIDRIFVGNYCGQDALASVTVCFSPTLFLLAIAMTIGHGSAAFVSIKLGQKDKEGAEKILGQAAFLFFAFYLSVLVITQTFMPQILTYAGATEKILPEAVAYFRIIIAGLIFEKISFGINNIVRAEGRPVWAMATILVGGVSNVFLDWLFIAKFGWGVKGAAYATIIAQAIASGMIFYFYFGSGKNYLKLKLKNIKLHKDIFKKVIALGSPSFVIQALAALSVYVFIKQASFYGSESAIAVFGIIATIAMFMFLPVVGVNMGVQTVIGYNWGALNFERVKKALNYALALATSICFLGFFIAEVFPSQLFSIFLDSNSPLIPMGDKALRIYVVCFPVVGVNIITSGFFQATGRPLVSIFITTLRQLILLIPLLFILPRYIGIEGVWLSYPIADVIAFITTLIFLLIEYKKMGTRSRSLSTP